MEQPIVFTLFNLALMELASAVEMIPHYGIITASGKCTLGYFITISFGDDLQNAIQFVQDVSQDEKHFESPKFTVDF